MSRALVTGANRGIGLELCRVLKGRGFEVVGACRRSSRELDELGVFVESGIDVTEEGAASELSRRLSGKGLDLVIQNAGILRPDHLQDLSSDAIREQFEANALGPLRLTQALVPLLSRGSKVAFVTSLMGSIGDNGSGGYYGYRMSKAALNIAAVSLARDLAPQGIYVAILHPGFVRTSMTGGGGNVSASESAEGLVAQIDLLTKERSGRFFHANGKELPW